MTSARWQCSTARQACDRKCEAGVACLLAIVILRQSGAGNGALITGQTLAILYGRIFALSQSLMPIVNDLLLGFLLYQSRLVPRGCP